MNKLYVFVITVIVVATSSGVTLGQACLPNSTFSSNEFGLYPEGRFLPDCSGTSSRKTIVGISDTTLPNPINPGNDVIMYFDAMRVDSVSLPDGLWLETDVMYLADSTNPYGVWEFTGTGPIFDPVMGCVNITGPSSSWNAADTTGLAGSDMHRVDFFMDFRVSSTDPDISFLIANGSWLSEYAILSDFEFRHLDTTVHTSQPLCGGLWVNPQVYADNGFSAECEGSVEVEVLYGTPPYTFNYSFSGSNSNSVDSLCVGIYDVDVTDSNGLTGFTQFAIPSDTSIYSEIEASGIWIPESDTLWAYMYNCDLNYGVDIDSAYVVDSVIVTTDTVLATWVVYQGGQPFTITGYYPIGGQQANVFAFAIFCQNGRAAPGVFLLFDYLDYSVSIRNPNPQIEFSVSPNPSNGEYLIQLDDVGTSSLEVIDVNGSLILSKNISSQSFSLDIVDASPGLYILKLQNEKGIGYRRLIKK